MPTDPYRTIPGWKFPEWHPQFQDVLLEFDRRKLPPLLEAATIAIFARTAVRLKVEQNQLVAGIG
jgi:hypothetical protein